MVGLKMSYNKNKEELIYWAKLLNQKGFVSSRSGNVSLKVDIDKILITAHDCYLGYLTEDEILCVNLKGEILEGNREITSEKLLHLDIHNRFKDVKVVLHAHPPHTIAFFHYFSDLDMFSFEAKFYLKNIKVIPQDTPIVTNTLSVLKALENSNIVVLKDHGIVSIGRDFKSSFGLIELLEEQAKVNLLIKDFKKSEAKSIVKEIPPKGYKLVSEEHIQKLIDLVNNDREAQELGKVYDLTCTLAVKNQDLNKAVCFYYEKGMIIKTDDNEDAEFVIIGREEILKKIFNRQLDPFVASTQGKVKTKGDFTKMSKWYPVLVRTFKLWEEAPVE
ncbi:MAG: class II aldolase/adducin family protein [Candidatus Omnitrophica bacterium]|nr:class II aldolase/adducin family protein [Candidatus Omnitrophota bacterium]